MVTVSVATDNEKTCSATDIEKTSSGTKVSRTSHPKEGVVEVVGVKKDPAAVSHPDDVPPSNLPCESEEFLDSNCESEESLIIPTSTWHGRPLYRFQPEIHFILPIIVYLDKTGTDFNQNYPLEPVSFSNGPVTLM